MCRLQFTIEVTIFYSIKFEINFIDPELLERIRWSDIDQQYRGNRERLKDLSFQVCFMFFEFIDFFLLQKFCSESGFMRFFPTAPWLWEDRQTELDLFDCRVWEYFLFIN
jgi:hypothetical protein